MALFPTGVRRKAEQGGRRRLLAAIDSGIATWHATTTASDAPEASL
jgi:hypothetical protein